MLAALALLSIGLAAVGERWADQAKRAKESELMRVGALYAKAIEAYYAASPGSLRRYPPELTNLLEDDRMVGTVRYIRKLYRDPIDPSRPWGLIRAPDGGILGIYSQSGDSPFRTEPLDLGITELPSAGRYSDWKFTPKVSKR
jgi:type II secretory pathway pseudopilin PulG